MPENIFGGQGATLLTAILIVAVALLALAGVFWMIRARSSSTFIRGGKNRQPRLAVLDATAVDTRRRLVLIRRDDVEHLVMIGGPTDIVVESRIVHPAQAEVAPPPAPQKAAPPKAEQHPARQEEQVAARQPAAQPQPRPPEARPAAAPVAPAPMPSPPAPTSRTTVTATPAPAAAAAGVVTASTLAPIHAEATDVLESARARVFEEPSFDEAAFDELAPAAPPPPPRMQPAPTQSAPPPAYAQPVAASPAPRPAEAAPQPAPQSTQAPQSPQAPHSEPLPVAGDFESVLAAELSEDLSLDISDDGFFEPVETEPRGASADNGSSAAPEVRPESQPSRDSLEAEMERLLGDLSRKP